MTDASTKPPPPSEGDVNLSSRRAAWQDAQLGPEARALVEEDARLFLHQSLSSPCLSAVSGVEGSRIHTVDGASLLDFHGNAVHQVGHAHPRVLAAVKAQLDDLAFSPRRYTNAPAVELARRLIALAPGDLSRVLFTPGGTSAIGVALKLARVATGRHKTISMWDSFHGASLDAISVGGEALFRAGVGPLLPGAEHVPPPDGYRCMWGCEGACQLRCADYIEYVLEKEGDVAAVVAETVRSVPYVPSPGYWRRVREACDRHGALLILDEIPTALGRTGRWFACEHFDVIPDILVIGKGLGGGMMPLAAVIAREHLNVAGGQALGHYTHEKNPVQAAAGLATLDVIDDEGLVQRAARLGERLTGQLRALQSRHELIGDVRGLGLLVGMELVRDRTTKERATDEADALLYAALARGLSFKVTMGNVITLVPPLTVSEAELDEAVEILDVCLGELEVTA